MKLTIVDVFAEAPYEGNQLAVVRDAGGLDARSMQRIAREMNFSETTFVIGESEGRAQVRIFTPNEELAFAGHPTLGTAWVLANGRRALTLELGLGDVAVSFERDIAWMVPPPGRSDAVLAYAAAAELVGLDTRDIDDDLGTAVIACGLEYSFVGVRSLEALGRARVDLEASRAGVDRAPFIVCRGGYSDDADFAARMFFFDGTGMREDPATGSANAAFAHYLAARGERGRFVVEQGFEIGRPARLYLEVGASVRVGGKVQPVAEGRLL